MKNTLFSVFTAAIFFLLHVRIDCVPVTPTTVPTQARTNSCNLKNIEIRLNDMAIKIDAVWKIFAPSKTEKNCAEYYKKGVTTDGIYSIDPDGKGSFKVFCDMTTSGGGWTVFQRRLDGSVDFYRGWQDYKQGFGVLDGEFWLGLDKIRRLTKLKRNNLRIDLGDTSGNTRYAEYSYFAVTSERAKYQLSVGTYSGTAGDSFTYHRGSAFSTIDSDNDDYHGDCAVMYKGPWWYKACCYSNLNGMYYHGAHSHGDHKGVTWRHWKGADYSLKDSAMKIRPETFGM
ncbi:microfibril-associated glycoprotein 4-like isoform X1 [Dendronephthya gigantea]|uniref:microfibril-associated glycoprotein 4-like isoform X1 n=1 Tax=Dendronephthya gigantea TaxID=151771 RepID=UPI00106A5110|nr:microfibril-associated glycoprotein 4-like isoform X1 [Dendronephthya gigantea]